MVKDLKELEKFLKLCRKQGVTDIEVEGLKIKLGDLPITKQEQSEAEEEQSQDELDLLTGLPKMAFYSTEAEQ